MAASSTTRQHEWSRLIVSMAMLAVAPGHPAVVSSRAGHARVELLSEQTAIARGGMTTLGIRFTIDEGWHIYWRNPGESGGAPTVVWTIPPELSVGDLEWPAPTRFAVPGDTTYGYTNAVLLLAPIRATDQSGTSTTFDVRARVDYQICKDVCLKETSRLSTTLPVGSSGTSPYADLFTSARANLPMSMPVGWTVSASVGPQECLLEVDTGRGESTALFFPYQPDLIDDSAAQRIDPRPTGLSLHLKKSSTFSARASLDGLLIRPGEKAVEISAGVR